MTDPLIRRADQVTIAALLVVSLAGIVVWWVGAGGWRGELVEIDNQAPLDYRFLVDVNRAEWPELAQLPGVGPELARRIVRQRGAGAYRSAEDLLDVPGIGPRRLEAIRRHLLPIAGDTQVAGDDEKKGTTDEHG
ncbi:MAG: helix-hairpin-helix domain-containing protein [Lacipirellulaceae bacterium]